MTKGPEFCFTAVYAMFLPFILFPGSPAYAEETKVYTDADLVNYKAEPIVDQESLSRMEDDLKSYQKKRASAALLEREKRKRQKVEEVKRQQRKKRT